MSKKFELKAHDIKCPHTREHRHILTMVFCNRCFASVNVAAKAKQYGVKLKSKLGIGKKEE